MWTYETIVSLSYRFLDLAIISGIGIYLFIRWGLPYFKNQMAAERQAWQDLEDQIESNVKAAGKLDTIITDDQQKIARLKEQVHIWASSSEQKKQERFIHKKEIAAQLHDWYEERMIGIAKDALYRKVVPQAIRQAEYELKEVFEDPAVGKTYIAQIINRLREGSS